MTLGKGIVPFHAKAELKQIAQAKILLSLKLIQKQGPPNLQKALSQNSSFLCSQNDHHYGDAINVDYATSLLIHFKNYKW